MASTIFSSMDDAASFLQEDAKGREAVSIVRQMMQSKSGHVPQPGQSISKIVVVEGLDGTGKSTLVDNLRQKFGESAVCLKSPPEDLLHLRSYFDGQPKQLRRAFYALGNYACAMRMSSLAASGPVIVDRFWPSTVAYALAHDDEIMPETNPDSLLMPSDLFELLPKGHPIVFLLLELSESQRARRVRRRSESMPAGFVLAVTREEEELERSKSHRARLNAAYHAISICGQPLTVCDASGSEEEVLERALKVIEEQIANKSRFTPVSVNWHYTRACNYSCKFCFHTAKTSFFLPKTLSGMEESKDCLMKLREAGMKKINFSGGEPFLQAKELGELCRFCKKDLELESVSIISNGSLIKKAWLEKFGHCVDILAISCDSFNEDTNIRIGRGKGMHVAQLEMVKDWCNDFGVPFKINSVINIHNVDEDMTAAIDRLQPVRWKVFQCLLLDGENAGEGALRDAKELVITNDQFETFLKRHQALKCMVPESNEKMKDSYLILDEELRFLNCTGGSKKPSRSIRDVPVAEALQEAGFDAMMFVQRGGIYNWSKPAKKQIDDLEDLGTNTQFKEEGVNEERDREPHFDQCNNSIYEMRGSRKLILVVVGSILVSTAWRFLKQGR